MTVTNEIREYAEQESGDDEEVEVEEEHVHWAPWSSSGVNTSMNYEPSAPAPTQKPDDSGPKAEETTKEPAGTKR